MSDNATPTKRRGTVLLEAIPEGYEVVKLEPAEKGMRVTISKVIKTETAGEQE